MYGIACEDVTDEQWGGEDLEWAYETEHGVAKINTDLEELQKFVGGYITLARIFNDKRLVLVCDEEGMLKGYRKMEFIVDESGNVLDAIYGNFLVLATDDDGEFTEMTIAQASEVYKYFGWDESYTEETCEF